MDQVYFKITLADPWSGSQQPWPLCGDPARWDCRGLYWDSSEHVWMIDMLDGTLYTTEIVWADYVSWGRHLYQSSDCTGTPYLEFLAGEHNPGSYLPAGWTFTMPSGMGFPPGIYVLPSPTRVPTYQNFCSYRDATGCHNASSNPPFPCRSAFATPSADFDALAPIATQPPPPPYQPPFDARLR